MSTDVELILHPDLFLPVWSVHPTILYDPLLFRAEGAEQAGGVCGGGQRRHPGVLGKRSPSENMTFRFMFHEDKHAKHALSLKRSWDNDIMSNNDRKWPKKFDNIKDGIEDANHNGRIDGDNNDGKWSESETWTELNPNAIDTDGDTFSDYNEKEWGYNPLSKDTDGDGLNDNVEDSSNYGAKDASETSAKNSDTDDDGLSDKMELDGWTVIIIYEATLEIKEEREVSSNPLIPDSDYDGLNDLYELKNGTDPNDDDTDDDGFDDKEEIDYDYGSSPNGIDGQPPSITGFNLDYELIPEISGPLYEIKIISVYNIIINVGVNDIFGIKWINVHIGEVGEEKKYFGEATEILNNKLKFKLDMGKATKSLFNNFILNISAKDNNDNIGFVNNKVPSVKEIIEDLFIKGMEIISIIVETLFNPKIFIEKFINNLLLNNIENIKLKFENNIKEFALLLHSIMKEEIIDYRTQMQLNEIGSKIFEEFDILYILWDCIKLIYLKFKNICEDIINFALNVIYSILKNTNILPERNGNEDINDDSLINEFTIEKLFEFFSFENVEGTKRIDVGKTIADSIILLYQCISLTFNFCLGVIGVASLFDLSALPIFTTILTTSTALISLILLRIVPKPQHL